jgi:hypothetical protein
LNASNQNGPVAGRSTTLDLATAIQPAKEAAAKLKRHAGRFEIYDVLRSIYRVYRDWKDRRIAGRSARLLASELPIVRRKGMSPIRVLIEAALPNANLKEKSRWVRALEYLSSEHVPAKEFRSFLRANGGLAGCARLAVEAGRKRARPKGDWTDD